MIIVPPLSKNKMSFDSLASICLFCFAKIKVRNTKARIPR